MGVSNSCLPFLHGNRDIISALPDAVLCHILSFLPTESAVRTSILCTRWRHTWTSVPVLHFDDTSVAHPQTSDHPNEQFFLQSVDRVLLLRRDNIKTLRLQLTSFSDCVSHHVYLWIGTAIMRNVEELDLDHSTIGLPQIIFSCKTLKILKLGVRIRFQIFESVDLPRLEVLHIKNSSVANLEKMVLGSPILKELVFYREYFDDDAVTLYVVSSSLKRLTIHQIDSQRGLDVRSMVIRAPELDFFELKDHFSGYFSVINVSSSPFSAAIDVRGSYTNHVLRLIKRISSVTVLRLSAYMVETLFKSCDETLPKFHFLTRLEIGAFGDGWLMLPKILKCAPKLEVLILYKEKNKIPDRTIFNEEESVPSCLLSSLKSVQLKRFRGNAAEMEVLKYFLKNGRVLKKLGISISTTTNFRKLVKILWKLIMFPRGSGTCRILLNRSF
ncbi:FBD-associated F-box protein At5g22730-like [Mercurialis annua]|uniref:FBD-associated F-box protein At5g22730-like n=1 Tax=Mercurialis annua TaxID=3986 RepID=UPI00215F6184|nr:FBD-associated F-box protein At5g22730-like [Mercurialis annua]